MDNGLGICERVVIIIFGIKIAIRLMFKALAKDDVQEIIYNLHRLIVAQRPPRVRLILKGGRIN